MWKQFAVDLPSQAGDEDLLLAFNKPYRRITNLIPFWRVKNEAAGGHTSVNQLSQGTQQK